MHCKFAGKFKRIGLVVVLMAAILFFNGCAVVGYRSDMASYKDESDDAAPEIYPCVRLDIDTMKKIIKGEEETVFFLLKPLVLLLYGLDTGVSFVFDTIGLPYDIYRSHKDREDKNVTNTTVETEEGTANNSL